MRSRFVLLSLLAGLFVTGAAHADTLSFTSTDGATTLFTTIPSGTPTFVVFGSGLAYYVPDLVFDGVHTSGYLGFYEPSNPGPSGQYAGADFAIFEGFTGQTYNFAGPQLYTGSEALPAFTLGSAEVTGVGGTSLSGTVNITPEPASLALLGTGVAALCGMGRRRLGLL